MIRKIVVCVVVCLLASCSDRATDDDQELSAAECSDQLDNDGDGTTDCDDTDCEIHSFCASVQDGGVGKDAAGQDAAQEDATVEDGGVDAETVDAEQPCTCDDNLDCTDDSCDENGQCRYVPQTNWCVIDGACYQIDEPHPDNSCRVCDPAGANDAWSILADDTPCDDGDACTANDVCSSGGCAGDAYSCASDMIECTEDACDGNGGCIFPVKADKCYIDGMCWEAGESVPYYPGDCQICDPAQSQTAWTDATDACTISGMCVGSGQRDSTGCQVCDPATSKTSWSPGSFDCKIGSTCFQAGDSDSTGCLSCDPTNSTTAWSPGAYGCKIGALCYEDGESDSTGCNVCDPASSTTAWTPVPSDCQIYGQCYVAGEMDATGCNVCDPASSTTAWTPSPDVCQINGMCYRDGAVHPENCARCDVSESTTAWTPIGDICFIDPYGPVPPPPPPYDPKQPFPPGVTSCFQPGERYYEGSCMVCDPAQSKTEWSMDTTSDCVIGDMCLNDGDPYPYADPYGITCAICDSSNDPNNWTVLPGTCMIEGQCWQGGDPSYFGDCQICDPGLSQTSWTFVSGKCALALYPDPYAPRECFDDGAFHYSGMCAKCDISVSETEWTIVSGCLIEGMCWADNDVNWMWPEADCQICNSSVSQTEWTTVAGKCAIYEDPMYPKPGGPVICVDDGDPHPVLSCAACDTDISTTDWSPVSGTCMVANACFNDGDTDDSGCLQCASAANPLSLEAASGVTTTEYTFDGGTLEGVTVTPPILDVGWQLSTKRAAGGTHSLYYGNPVTNNYDTGAIPNKGSAVLPDQTLVASKGAALSFWLWMEVEPYDSYGHTFTVEVTAGGSTTPVWSRILNNFIDMGSWRQVVVDLSEFAGETISIAFTFDTVETWGNYYEGIYLDSIQVISDCTTP